MHRPMVSRAAVLLVAFSTLVAACSGDQTSTPSTTSKSPASKAASTDFCGAAGDLVNALSSGGDPSKALAAAIASAPKPLSDHLATMGEKVGAASASGDEAAFKADDLRASVARALGEIASTCAYQIADVSATEYAFDGLPTMLATGLTAFRMKNGGSEVHEMLFYRRAKGTKGDLVDIVNDDPTVSDGRLEEVGVMLPAAPEENSVLLLDLTPGDYVAVCYLHKGTTTMDQVGNEGDAPDHRSLGMIQAFTVG